MVNGNSKGAIFLMEDDNLIELSETEYESEDPLQGFLEKYPALL